MILELDFRLIYTHNELIELLESTNSLNKDEKIVFRIDFNGRKVLHSDLLLMIVIKINNLREKGVDVNVEFGNLNKDSDAVRYASRMNFFKSIGIESEEDFNRYDAANRFVEITAFDDDNVVEVADKIVSILIEKGLDDDLMTTLNFCIYEVLDNTLNHSKGDFIKGAGKGYVSAQYFPTKDLFRMIIADCGVGIHQALTKHPESKFKDLDEKKAVEECVKKGVTNSMGMGFGLWGTSEMVKQNDGELFIHSGNHCLIASKNGDVFEKANWKGTFTYLEINTLKSVNLEAIFEKDAKSKRELYLEYKEQLVDEIKELW